MHLVLVFIMGNALNKRNIRHCNFTDLLNQDRNNNIVETAQDFLLQYYASSVSTCDEIQRLKVQS